MNNYAIINIYTIINNYIIIIINAISALQSTWCDAWGGGMNVDGRTTIEAP
jgi:hypothetical protein